MYRHMAWCNKFKQHKGSKRQIKKYLMASKMVGLVHFRRWEKEIDPFWLTKSNKKVVESGSIDTF